MARAGSSEEPSSLYRTRDVAAGVRSIAAAAGGYALAVRWCDFGNIPIRLSSSVVLLVCLWCPANLFDLQQSLAFYDYSHEQIQACDRVIEAHLQALELPEAPPLEPTRRVRRRKDNEVTFDARQRLHHLAGVDLTAIEGIEESTALVVLSKIGTDMSRWPSEKHFGRYLVLAPNPKKSGVKCSRVRSVRA